MSASTTVSIVTFDPRYRQAFAELNYEWIQTHFQVEAMDRHQLSHPEDVILKTGGEVFFLIENEVVVGTCAMIPHGPNGYELAKMAVAPSGRGKGYGDLLMKTCIEWARRQGAREIILLSNTVLEPAIRLYKKHGFKTMRLGDHPDYQRCNIEMSLALN